MQLCRMHSVCHRRSGNHQPFIPQVAEIRAALSRQIRHAAAREVTTRAASGDLGNTARGPNYDSVSFRQDSGASASTSAVIDVTDDSQKQTRMEDMRQFLEAELERIFEKGVSCRSRYFDASYTYC